MSRRLQHHALCLLLVCFASPTLAAITVTDFVGRRVSLQQPAQRIVALAPHVVENLYSAGAGAQLVGAVSYSDFPQAARAITRVGSYKAFSLETIISLRPDLIIMWASGNGMTVLDDLGKLQIPVYVSEPRRLSDISRAIRDYGKLAGSRATSEAEAARIDAGFATLRQRHSASKDLRVMYQVWHEPLQTLNAKHLISDVIRLCGGSNIFADTVSLAPKISLESVLQRDPDVIIASGMDIARPEWLDKWLQYPFLTAVQNQALYFIHPDHLQRPTARVLLGATEMCRMLQAQR